MKNVRGLRGKDMVRIIIGHESLFYPVSTKMTKIKWFNMVTLDKVIGILEYNHIPIDECMITLQSIKIPAGKARLPLTKDSISNKSCIITIKNSDSICLARSIVMAYANMKPER